MPYRPGPSSLVPLRLARPPAKAAACLAEWDGDMTGTGRARHWNNPGHNLTPVLAELKAMRAKGRRGHRHEDHQQRQIRPQPEDREKSGFRFAMRRRELDAIVIGFKSTAKLTKPSHKNQRWRRQPEASAMQCIVAAGSDL